MVSPLNHNHNNNNTIYHQSSEDLSPRNSITPRHSNHKTNANNNNAGAVSTTTSNPMTLLADYYSITYGTNNAAASSSSSSSALSSANHHVKNLFIRMKTLQRKDSNKQYTPTEYYSLAIRWKNLVKELFQLSDSIIYQDILDLYYQVLVDFHYFYEMELGNQDEKWEDFIQQQEVS
jgi:hypothetical protein